MLQASHLECVRGDRSLFREVAFTLAAGGLLEVRGHNGSGKTSLLRMLCGLSAPAHGEIHWQGQSISALGADYFKDLILSLIHI